MLTNNYFFDIIVVGDKVPANKEAIQTQRRTNMRKYIAIGHFKDSKNITSVAMKENTMKDFRDDCGGNEFIPMVILTEKKMETIKKTDEFHLYDEVKKMTSNYRKWNDICDYIEQCFDIMEEKMEKAE